MDFDAYAKEINMTARTALGSFLTTGTKEQYPKEHQLLVLACTEAHKCLGPEVASIRPGNFLSKLSTFEKECVNTVKEKVIAFTETEITEEERDKDNKLFSPLLADLYEENDAIFSWVTFLLFACMRNYHDKIEFRKAKQDIANGNYGRGGFSPRGGRGRGGARHSEGGYGGGGGGGEGEDYNRAAPRN
jgi:uncharacterized membrane protein YgcG